ncbi:MAG: Ni/Fe-hydrogenase, b-type cytochrome subunit [Gemmatimonadales bacterium]
MTPAPSTTSSGREHPPGFHLGREVPKPQGDFKWVYLWGWPIRAMHWIAAFCIVALAVTGFYIGKPYFIAGGDTGEHYLMGWMRFVHFSAAAVFVATGIIRGYWLLAGNRFERLAALFPIRPRDWVNGWKYVKFYLMIHPERAPHYLGHNPLQQFSYTGIYLAALIMVLTGFNMYGQSNPDGFFYHTFGWVASVLGGLQNVRFTHHVVTWVFLIFIPIHVYLAVRADIIERAGAVSSVITGGRFVRSDKHFVDE